MATKEEILLVIEDNKKNQQLAREVNLRAGETVFPVYTQHELTKLLAENLKGARCIEETQQAWRLRLPILDQEIVEMVFADNPESVIIPRVGRCKIKYLEKRFPQVDLSKEWVKLSADEIKLPSGRLVFVSVKLDDGTVFGPRSNLTTLKEECVDYLVQKAFCRWVPPKLQIPDFSEINDELLEIQEEKFGKHPLGGSRMIAYGALTLERSHLKWKWFVEKESAELALEEIRTKVSSMEGSMT